MEIHHSRDLEKGREGGMDLFLKEWAAFCPYELFFSSCFRKIDFFFVSIQCLNNLIILTGTVLHFESVNSINTTLHFST